MDEETVSNNLTWSQVSSGRMKCVRRKLRSTCEGGILDIISWSGPSIYQAKSKWICQPLPIFHLIPFRIRSLSDNIFLQIGESLDLGGHSKKLCFERYL